MARFAVGNLVKCIKKCNKDVAEPVLDRKYVVSHVYESGQVELAGVYDGNSLWSADQFELVPDEPAVVGIAGEHYADLVIQPADYAIKNNMPWAEGSVVKYVTRHRSKNGREDLIKAKYLIDLLIKELYPE